MEYIKSIAMATVIVRYLPKPYRLFIFLWLSYPEKFVKNPSMDIAYATPTKLKITKIARRVVIGTVSPRYVPEPYQI